MQRRRKRNNHALSVLIVKGNEVTVPAKLFAVVGQSDQVVELVMEHEGNEKFGLQYYKFGIVRSDLTTDWEAATNCFVSPILGFGLLLPLLDNGANARGFFAVVSDNWKRLGPTNTLNNLVG